MVGKIIIGKPHIKISCVNTVKMSANIELPSVGLRELFVEVPIEYSDYLTSGRGDAFLVGLLRYALYHCFDIKCKVPVTAELHYHLSNILIPALTDHGKIKADLVDGKFENVGAVGTGISCGVDSMHVLKNQLNNPIKSMFLQWANSNFRWWSFDTV